MAEVNIDVAKEESVQTVDTKVGTSSDTASNIPTTLFSGIKGLIAWFTGTWTAARAAKIDTIDTNAVNIINYVGLTGSTGGTPTAGSAMAKLNALLTNMTSTRAGYIDTIKSSLENATYGLSALKTAITGGSVPVVKSIQTGTLSKGITTSLYDGPFDNYYRYYVDITVSSFNVNKAVCIANVYNTNSAVTSEYRAMCKIVSANVLRVYVITSGTIQTMTLTNAFSWELVEFY